MSATVRYCTIRDFRPQSGKEMLAGEEIPGFFASQRCERPVGQGPTSQCLLSKPEKPGIFHALASQMRLPWEMAWHPENWLQTDF